MDPRCADAHDTEGTTMFNRLRAILAVPPGNFPQLEVRATAVADGLGSDTTLFVNPNPILPVLLLKLSLFSKAQQLAVTTHAKADYLDRNAKGGALLTCLESERAYVQERADACASPADAELVIVKGGMVVAQNSTYHKPHLRVRQQKPGGPVQVVAHVGMLTESTVGAVFFNWQYTSDGGVTWITLPPTTRGRTEIGGLTPLSTYGFRVAVTDAKGTGIWGQMVTFFVH
jgi:hypothetical protein